MLQRVKEESNIEHTVNRRKDNWIGHILCRNCLLKQVIGGKIEATGRRERRYKPLLDNLEEMQGYWK